MEGHSNSRHIRVENPYALGRLLIDWCRREKHQLPDTVGAVQEEFREWNINATFSTSAFDSNSTVTIIQTAVNEWVVPLLPPEFIDETLDFIQSEGKYPVDRLPSYLTAYPRNGRVYDEDFFYARLADFTVSQCE